jgi:uncharacterized protein YjdB
MRSSLPAAPGRALARLAGAAAVAVVLSACSFITGVPGVSRVELSVPVTTIAPGQQIQAVGVPLGGSGNVITHNRRQVRYSSSNDSIATVSPTGVITGVNTGRATIRATSDDESASVEITVRPVPVTRLIINNRSAILRFSPSVTGLLSATALDTAGRPLDNRPATWRSLETNIVDVSSVGVVTPRGLGTARIVASVDTGLAPAVGTVADTVPVRVTVTPVSSVRITQRTATLYTGDTLRFVATVVDSLNNVVADRRVVWSTSDRGSLVAIDSLTGLARAVSSGGNVTLTATVETVQGFPNTDFRVDQVAVQVLARAATTRVTNTTGQAVTSTALRAGGAQQLVFTALDAVGNQLSGRQFRVTSDAEAVATASVGGLVTANAAGSATITVQPLDAAGAAQGTPATVVVTVAP